MYAQSQDAAGVAAALLVGCISVLYCLPQDHYRNFDQPQREYDSLEASEVTRFMFGVLAVSKLGRIARETGKGQIEVR